jgi:cysteine synthase B
VKVIAELLEDVVNRAPRVGGTPLVRLNAYEPRADVQIFAKLESRNPGGSVKDRAALSIVLDGLRSGALAPGRVLLDATSGNTGIAYAMIGASLGIRVRLCVPANVTAERKRLLQAYGATLVFTDAMEGSDGAIREAQRIAASDPDRYFYADQYANPANWRAHYETTGPELVQQTQGRLTHFVAGLGTSGTFIGTGRRLRERLPGVRLVSVEPDSPLHALEGLKHMATSIVPPIYDATLADQHETVETEEALELTRHLALRQGLLVGPSSGAALVAARRVARDVEHGVIVVVFPDSGERYLSESTSGVGFRAGSDPGTGKPTPDVDSVIRRHAAHAYPDECCGALIGHGDRVVEAFALSNGQSENRKRRFLIGPDEYRRAEARADERSASLLGFYHSHPDHPAVPSAFDLEHAWPNLTYAIVSVRGGQPKELRSWRLRADRSGFTEEILNLEKEQPCL